MQLEYAEKEESLIRAKQLHFVLPALSVLTPHHKAPILRVLYINDSQYMCAGQVRYKKAASFTNFFFFLEATI